MKSFIITLLLVGFLIPMSSQVKKTEKEIRDENLKPIELPGIVLKSAGKDFSIYLPDSNNPDYKVRMLEEKLISYNLGKDEEGYDEYLVVMELKNNSIAATYNQDGKLMRVVEEYKNVRLPANIIYMIYKNYPGWKIVKDKFLYTQEDGDIKKKQYHVKIKKEKINEEVIKLVVYPDSNTIKVTD